MSRGKMYVSPPQGEIYLKPFFYRGSIGVGVQGVTGRGAIVHERRRSSSQKAMQ